MTAPLNGKNRNNLSVPRIAYGKIFILYRLKRAAGKAVCFYAGGFFCVVLRGV